MPDRVNRERPIYSFELLSPDYSLSELRRKPIYIFAILFELVRVAHIDDENFVAKIPQKREQEFCFCGRSKKMKASGISIMS